MRLAEEAGPVLEKWLGPTDGRTTNNMQMLAHLYHEEGRHKEARALERHFGPSRYTRDRRRRLWIWTGAIGGSLVLIGLAVYIVRRRRRRPPAEPTPQPHPANVILTGLAGRRTWPVTELKVCAIKANVRLKHQRPDDTTVTLHIWERSDHDVPILRIDDADTAYELSIEEYAHISEYDGS